MKLIESKAEYIPQEEGLEGIYKMIELAGRTAYHSQNKITPDSAKDFVDRMIKSKHGAALEHGTVYLELPNLGHKDYTTELGVLVANITTPYTKIVDIPDGHNDSYTYALTTNMRVIEEIPSYLQEYKGTLFQYLCSPTEFHEKRYTMRFTCSRAVAQELTRHRVFSFLMESQRYINYSKEKHGGEIPIIIPSWSSGLIEGNTYDMTVAKICSVSEGIKPLEQRFLMAMCFAEEMYFEFLEDGFTPQQARDVLPNATKTELIMTGFASDWARLFELRMYESTGKVAPDMKVLMQKAWKEFENYGITRDLERYIKL